MFTQIKQALKRGYVYIGPQRYEIQSRHKSYYLFMEEDNDFIYIANEGDAIVRTTEFLPTNKNVGVKVEYNKKEVKALIKLLLQENDRYWSLKDHIDLIAAKIRYFFKHR